MPWSRPVSHSGRNVGCGIGVADPPRPPSASPAQRVELVLEREVVGGAALSGPAPTPGGPMEACCTGPRLHGRGRTAQAHGAPGRAGWLGRWRRKPWPAALQRSGPGVSQVCSLGPAPGHERAAIESSSRGARLRPLPWRGSRTTSCWWRSGRTRAVSAEAQRPGDELGV